MIAKDNFATGAKLKSTPLEKSSHYLKHYEANMKAGFDPTGKRLQSSNSTSVLTTSVCFSL